MANFIAHSRTPGSKNGERRYQNEDGTWTPLGLERRRAEYAAVNRAARGRFGLRAIGALGATAAITGAVAGIKAANGKTLGVEVDNPLKKDKDWEKLKKNGEPDKVTMKYDPETGKALYTYNRDRAFAPGKDGKPSNMQKIMNSSSDIMTATKQATDAMKGNKIKFGTDDLSNQDLEKMVRRMSLEKQYNELRQQDIGRGKDRLGTFLAAAGSLVAIGASAATILTAISQIKGKK